MKKLLGNKNIPVSPKQLYDFYTTNAKIEQDKIDSQKKLMEEKLKKATKGRNIVISNYSKSDTVKPIK
jgi:hypothetical protein